MSKPRLYVRDWKTMHAYEDLGEYFDIDIFREIAGEVEEYDCFLLHHFSWEEDIEPLRNIWGRKPVVIEITGEDEESLNEKLEKHGVPIDDVYIEKGTKKSPETLCDLFGFSTAALHNN